MSPHAERHLWGGNQEEEAKYLLKVRSTSGGPRMRAPTPALGGPWLVKDREQWETGSHPETQPGDSWRACGMLTEDKIQILCPDSLLPLRPHLPLFSSTFTPVQWHGLPAAPDRAEHTSPPGR